MQKDETCYYCLDQERLGVRSWIQGDGRVTSVHLSVQDLNTEAGDNPPSRYPADTKPVVSVVFAKADQVRNCDDCQAAFSKKFAIPSAWWTMFARRSNGYFGFEEVLDDRGYRDGTIITWVRFMVKRTSVRKDGSISYEWTKLNAFSRWHPEKQHTDIILFDHPLLAESIATKILTNIDKDELTNPLWFYPRMIEEIISLQDLAVWEARDLVREVEKNRDFFKLDFPRLHDIPRHLIHVSETLSVSEVTIESIQRHLDLPGSSDFTSLTIRSRLAFHHHMLTSLRHRADANKARIHNEMSLAYNDAARVDSSAMRTIAFVSLFFLPATFVSAVFSTSFFNFDANSGIWAVSPKFWLFWVVSIPLTIVSITLWYARPYIEQWVRRHIEQWVHRRLDRFKDQSAV